MRALLTPLVLTLLACDAAEATSSSGAGGESDSTTASSATSSATGETTTGTGGAPEGGGGQGGSGGTPFVPEPIPDVPDDVPGPCQAVLDNPWPPQFLYDGCDVKRYPSYVDRELACPVVDSSATIPLVGGGSATYAPSTAPIEVDTTALSGLVPAELRVVVVLIRRVNGVPHYRYLSNGTHDIPYQPWSTSKFLAAANAGRKLRFASAGEVGLTASVDGYPLGDLVTSVASYDYDPFSSNALGRYFHNIGGRANANALIHDAWLGRPASETFGGNYGEAAPGLGYTFSEEGGPTISVTPDTTAGPANSLSGLTIAEALRRIVLHREEVAQRMPDLQWEDVKVVLYGADGSPKGPFGGLSDDPAILLQTGHDIDYLEARSHGRWRIFSKLGNGTSGELLNVGYACLPVLDDADQPVPGWGREFVIAANLPTGGATWAERDRILATSYRAIVERIVDGRL
jgi:hypothetical protein